MFCCNNEIILIVFLVKLLSLLIVSCKGGDLFVEEVYLNGDNVSTFNLNSTTDVDELNSREFVLGKRVEYERILQNISVPAVEEMSVESDINNLILSKSNNTDITEKCITNSFQEVIYSIHYSKIQAFSETGSGCHINKAKNITGESNGTNPKQYNCIIQDRGEILDVQVVNDSSLNQILSLNPNITSRTIPANCSLIYFFSPSCPFSTQGSAYVNALARVLKNIPVYGLNCIQDHGVNSRYGVMGTPSLFLFHNGNVAGRYNASEFSTSKLEAFINYYTNQNVNQINVTSADFKSNLPSIVKPASLVPLYTAWFFLVTCGSWLFFTSIFYKKLMETILNNWREAEAHSHQD